MPITAAKCTSCGANLEVDNTKDAAVCPYCGTPYVVEKAINNYNTTNNITANVVNVYGGNPADFEIIAGVLKKYTGAAANVVIPDGVTEIGALAFRDCSGLTSITIPDSVTEIGEYAFSECSSLTSVTIPDSVTEIGDSAFCYCTGLTSIIIPGRVTKIGAWSFKGCRGLTSITFPDSLTEIGEYAFSECNGLTSITIPNSVTRIKDGAFYYCSGLTSVNIGNPNAVISSTAFDKTPWDEKRIPVEQKNASSSKGGCYVATAVYGSYDCPPVWVLRRFRDYTLAESLLGRLFIRAYYAVSPALVRRFGDKAWFNRLFRGLLNRFTARLRAKGVAETPYEDKVW